VIAGVISYMQLLVLLCITAVQEAATLKDDKRLTLQI